MQMRRNQLFKLVEIDKGLVIIESTDNVGRGDKQAELIIADMPTMAEYLVRYHEARTQGLGIKQAHDRALHGAHVIETGVAELSDTLKVVQ